MQILQVGYKYTLSAYRRSRRYEVTGDFRVIQRAVWQGQWSQCLVAQQFKNRRLDVRQAAKQHSEIRNSYIAATAVSVI